ncbi:5743_t:CDS:1, partial [Funneliformis caledonium]
IPSENMINLFFDDSFANLTNIQSPQNIDIPTINTNTSNLNLSTNQTSFTLPDNNP